jgi:hypothetical protein
MGAVLAAVLVGSLTAPAPVTALAADGARVAFASGCELRLWTPPARHAPRLGSLPCPRTSTGSGIAAVSLAGNRALWVHYTGGNIREWSLWTATPTSRPKRVRFVAQDVDLPPPIMLGEGDTSRFGDLLPYAVGDEVIVLRADGSRRFAWRAPGRVLDLSANGGELAVLSADGTLTLLDGTGSVFDRGSVVGASAMRITGNATVLQVGRTLRVDGVRDLPLPARARLADGAGTRVVYVADGAVHLLDFQTNADRVIARGALAQLELRRLTIAGGRRVTQTRLG